MKAILQLFNKQKLELKFVLFVFKSPDFITSKMLNTYLRLWSKIIFIKILVSSLFFNQIFIEQKHVISHVLAGISIQGEL